MKWLVLMILMVLMMIAMSMIALKLEKQVAMLQSQQISLSENLAELKSRLDDRPEIGPTVEQQLDDARNKIFTEWIQNIANYNPFNNGE